MITIVLLQMLPPALSTQSLKSYLRSKKKLENVEKIAMNDVEQAPCKKLKSLSFSTSPSAHEDCGNLGSSIVVKLDIFVWILIYSSN